MERAKESGSTRRKPQTTDDRAQTSRRAVRRTPAARRQEGPARRGELKSAHADELSLSPFTVTTGLKLAALLLSAQLLSAIREAAASQRDRRNFFFLNHSPSAAAKTHPPFFFFLSNLQTQCKHVSTRPLRP